MNNSFIKHTLVTAISVSMLILTACSGNDTGSNVSDNQTTTASVNNSTKAVVTDDIESIYQELAGKISFNDTMEVVTDDYSEMLIGVSASNYTDCVLYMGSGATAEELLIFKVSGKENADAVVAALETHIEDQKLAFAGYDPEELKILEEAYIASSDSIVICCVCGDMLTARAAMELYLR